MREELPRGWANVELPTIAKLNMGQSPPSLTYNTKGEGLPFFQGKAEFGDIHPCPVKYCSSPSKIAEPGDILISVRAPVGPTNLNKQRSCIGRGLAAIRPLGEIPSRYLLHYFRHIEDWLSKQGTGSTFTAISRKDLEDLMVPLAPLAEQGRMVAKLEKLLDKVDACRERLEKVPAAIKRFRHSVLTAACSGKLTADWRGKQVTPAAPSAPEETPNGLPSLPETWRWGRLEFICENVVDCPHSTPKWTSSGHLCVRTTNFKPGLLDLSETSYVSDETFAERTQRLSPRPGDVLYSREGGILGVACMIPLGIELCLGQRMILFRTKPGFLSALLMCWLNSQAIMGTVQELTGGSASPHLNVKDIKNFPTPVPPVPEQQEIVRRVEELFTLADRIEARCMKAKIHIEKLTQSILAKAFRGELVSQDPNDEPASVLLERIKEERKRENPTKKAATRRNKRKG